jgi:hypothetical protein
MIDGKNFKIHLEERIKMRKYRKTVKTEGLDRLLEDIELDDEPKHDGVDAGDLAPETVGDDVPYDSAAGCEEEEFDEAHEKFAGKGPREQAEMLSKSIFNERVLGSQWATTLLWLLRENVAELEEALQSSFGDRKGDRTRGEVGGFNTLADFLKLSVAEENDGTEDD